MASVGNLTCVPLICSPADLLERLEGGARLSIHEIAVLRVRFRELIPAEEGAMKQELALAVNADELRAWVQKARSRFPISVQC